MLATIGIGQGGSMICDKFAELGVPSAIINYLQTDLDSCSNVKLKLKMNGSEGVGKQRELARELMNNNHETATSFIKEHFSQPSTELILIIFSTGGGSGSGIAPILTELLMNDMPDKTYVLCPILPDSSESVTAHLNTLNTLSDISQLEVALAPIDNENVSSLVGGKNALYQAVNGKFVHSVLHLIEYTERNGKYGNIDKRDILTMFSTKGFLSISEVDITASTVGVSLQHSAVTKSIQESWDRGVFTPPCLEQVVKAGVIYDGQESLMSLIKPKEVFTPFGNQPLDIFEGWYTGETAKIITILTGMKFNPNRLQQMRGIVEKSSKSIQSMLDNDISIPVSTISFSTISKPQQKKNISEILNRFKR